MANRQIVEICKAILRNARVLILDEPTASITVEEQRRLFDVIRDLKARGVTIIYISHRLDELFEICDRVSILRDGKYIDTVNIADTDKQGLIKLMVGRELSENYPVKDNKPSDEVVLEVNNLSGNGVRNISFQLHKGEILGFAGLVGAGRTELMHLIYGAASSPRTASGRAASWTSPSSGTSPFPTSRSSAGAPSWTGRRRWTRPGNTEIACASRPRT